MYLLEVVRITLVLPKHTMCTKVLLIQNVVIVDYDHRVCASLGANRCDLDSIDMPTRNLLKPLRVIVAKQAFEDGAIGIEPPARRSLCRVFFQTNIVMLEAAHEGAVAVRVMYPHDGQDVDHLITLV
jgi:hypothetical protein